MPEITLSFDRKRDILLRYVMRYSYVLLNQSLCHYQTLPYKDEMSFGLNVASTIFTCCWELILVP